MRAVDPEAATSFGDAIARVHQSSEIRLEDNFKSVRREIYELALFTRTGVTLMIEKGLITEDEFLERVQQVDVSDRGSDQSADAEHGADPL